jgi:hypothetical protein
MMMIVLMTMTAIAVEERLAILVTTGAESSEKRSDPFTGASQDKPWD